MSMSEILLRRCTFSLYIAIVIWLLLRSTPVAFDAAEACLSTGFGCGAFDYGGVCEPPVYGGGWWPSPWLPYVGSSYGYPSAAYPPAASVGPYCCGGAANGYSSSLFGRRKRLIRSARHKLVAILST